MSSFADIACELVGEWMKAFDVKHDIDLQLKLCREEYKEWVEAGSELDRNDPETIKNYLKESADFRFVCAGLLVMIGEMSDDDFLKLRGGGKFVGFEDRVSTFWPLSTITGEIFGITEEMQTEAFRRVCQSNMSKLGEDGKPIRREDGKVLKGPNYKPPYLDDLVQDFAKAA